MTNLKRDYNSEYIDFQTLVKRAQSSTQAHTATYLLALALLRNPIRSYFFMLYAYTRWHDDFVDDSARSYEEKQSFVTRQSTLLEELYLGQHPSDLQPEEQYLYHLVQLDLKSGERIRPFFHDMFAAFAFDAQRWGKAIVPTEEEIETYVERIGRGAIGGAHCLLFPNRPLLPMSRYLLGEGIEMVHMIRDFPIDLQEKRVNISRQEMETFSIDSNQINTPAFCLWVRNRCEEARWRIQTGQEILVALPSLAAKLAWYLYSARYEWLLRKFANDDYRLRLDYSKTLREKVGFVIFLACVTVKVSFDHYQRILRDRLSSGHYPTRAEEP